ncbi:uncharacterized protein E0L32_012309, partial [Thyridium curvatum]
MSSSSSRKSRMKSVSNVMYTNAVYFPNYMIYKGDTPGQLNYGCISLVYYAFANIAADGAIFLSDEWADAGVPCDGVQGGLGSLMHLKQKHPHLQVVLSVGGGATAESFPIVAASPVMRDNFARSALGLVEASGLDGVDSAAPHATRAQGADFLALLAAVRIHLTEDRYLLTAALPAGKAVLQNVDLKRAADYLDFVNLMAYDFFGPWTHKCGHQAQLYSTAKDETSGSSGVQYLISHGFPAKKILLGISLYGRSFLNTSGPGHKFKGSGGEDGAFEYRELPRRGAKEQVDKRVVAAQCVGGDGGFVSYDNPDTVKVKAGFCRQKGLGGIFYWTAPADAKDSFRVAYQLWSRTPVAATAPQTLGASTDPIGSAGAVWDTGQLGLPRQRGCYHSSHYSVRSMDGTAVVGSAALDAGKSHSVPSVHKCGSRLKLTTVLETADYDPINHLNALFAQPSSVQAIARVSDTLRTHNDGLSASITALETAQAYGPDSSLERMQSAQAELASLFRRIESVRSRALQTERDITTMTADIKRLDGTKRNLTLSMTALKRLQMLTTAYEQLQGLARTRQYRECAGLLQAVLQLMRHFNSYRSIEQIAVLSRGVSELQRELLEQVCEDFEMAFAKGEVGLRRPVLVEACLVMDALGDTARSRLVTWYVNTELREYRQVFRGNDEAGSLDNIGRRYAWFKRMLKTHEEEHAAIFPAHWRVNEMLAMAFCDGTREDFKGILERSMRRTDGAKLDVNLLLSCLQETMDFEHGLEKRFASELPRASIDTLSSADERTQSFHGSISVAFEPYLSLWVDAQDRQLAALIPKYRNQSLIAEDEEFSPQAVIPSAIELFHFYKTTLSQCAKLSTGDRLLDLAKTLARYLDEYANQVLDGFLKKGGHHGPSIQDTIIVLNTADFWHINTEQLEENIKKRIDPELASKVDLSSQSDNFMRVAMSAVLSLVNKVKIDCEGAWREMKNTNWSKMESVSDHSSYVGELLKHINEKVAEILPLVVKHQYARAFCDNLVEQIATAYIETVVLCRPVSEVAAEQMLLDKYVLTKDFEKLLSHQNPPSSSSPDPNAKAPAPPAGFVKRVNQAMGRIDPLLKTLQVRPSPPEGLVQAYLIHVGDRSDTNFKKVLELKGVRKADQSHLMELFAIHRDGASGRDKLVQNSPLLTPLMAGGGAGGVAAGALGGAGFVGAAAAGGAQA